jgi:chromosome segregation ATPase
MARAGLYKSDVKKARDALIAQGRHPSLDAIRIELGNTGSKTTIHKYLKELEEEQGFATNGQVSVSEAILKLVERLAMQLEAESTTKIDDIKSQVTERERDHANKVTELTEQIELLNERLRDTDGKYKEQLTTTDQVREQLRNESIARHTAEQHVADLKERLLENEEHRRSLEEKHQHAREALEHYRSSVKEQREQDARRHEEQVQQLQAEMRQLQQSLVVKQEENTRLNLEGARLIGELTHAEISLRERDSKLHRAEQMLEELSPFKERCKQFEKQLEVQTRKLAEREAQLVTLNDDRQRIEVELATTTAKIDGQEGLIAELRALLNRMQPKPSA